MDMGKSDRYLVICIEVNEKKRLESGGEVLAEGERQAGFWDQAPERT